MKQAQKDTSGVKLEVNERFVLLLALKLLSVKLLRSKFSAIFTFNLKMYTGQNKPSLSLLQNSQ